MPTAREQMIFIRGLKLTIDAHNQLSSGRFSEMNLSIIMKITLLESIVPTILESYSGTAKSINWIWNYESFYIAASSTHVTDWFPLLL